MKFTGLCMALIAAVILTSACNEIDDDRIPALPVSINLADPGMWNSFGVSGFGIHRYFILPLKEPASFHYDARSATGFGGVLLIGGMDPFTNETDVPLAYDLACPVERSQSVRVAIDPQSLEAVCPDCGSHYDVTMAGGSPLSGPAATGPHRYGLRRYSCLPSPLGGYYISN